MSEVQNRTYVDQMLKLWALSQSDPKVFLAELNENADLISQSEKKRQLRLVKRIDNAAKSRAGGTSRDENLRHVSGNVTSKKAVQDDVFVSEYISNIDYLVDRITRINHSILSWRDAQSAQLKYRYMNLDKPLSAIASELKVPYPSIKHIIAKAQIICVDSMRIRKPH